MPGMHGDAIQEVCDRTGHAIIFRAVGTQSTLLLEEGYAAKGFRIDTKSCDWGPARGFVCVDPRLSKVGGDEKKAKDNKRYTTEALEGRIRMDAVGGLDVEAMGGEEAVMPDWMAGCKPVVISAKRYLELIGSGLSGTTDAYRIIRGVSTDKTKRVRFPWALIPVDRCQRIPGFVAACGSLPTGGYGVFVDSTNKEVSFTQDLPHGLRAIKVFGEESVLGLINPGTDQYGYRACVTGDYDLFAVWPPVQRLDPFAGRNWDVRIVERYRQMNPESAKPHFQQHYRLGNITGRLNMIKVLLNTAFIGKGGFPGGNLVHHSDEVGNPSPGLKKTLIESFPLLAFVPRDGWKLAKLSTPGLCVKNTLDFASLVNLCQKARISPDIRPEWRNFTSV